MTNFELKTIKRDELSPVAAIGTLFFFIFGFLITHEVSVQDSLQLCGTLLLDLVTGSMLWILISRKSNYSMFELFGVGAVLGTTIPAIIGLLSRESVLYSVSSYFFSSLIIILFLRKRRKANLRQNISQLNGKNLLAVCSIALIIISGDAAYLWSGAISLAIGILMFQLFERKRYVFPFRKWTLLLVTNGIIFISLAVTSKTEFLIYGKRTITSYISGWDGTSYEARSKGLLNYGPFDNLWQSNLKFAYYWFADAWSGSLTSRSHASDWIVTTQFGYIVLALVAVCLLVAILLTKISNTTLCFIATAYVATTTVIGNPSFLFNLGSFSHDVSVIWFIFMIFLINDFFINREIRTLPVISYVTLLLVMTKTTMAVPVLAGLLMMSLFLIFNGPKNKKHRFFLFWSILSALGSVGLYHLFIKPEAVNTGTYSEFKIELVNNLFGISTNIIFIDILLLAIYKLAPIFWIIKSPMFKNQKFEITLLLISLVSISLSLLFRFNFSSASTFIGTPFLIIVALLSAVAICQKLSMTNVFKNMAKWPVISLSIIGMGSGLIATLLLQYFNFLFFDKTLFLIFVTSVPLVAGLFAVICQKLFSSWFYKFRLPNFILFTLVITASMSGSYVAQSLRSFQQEVLYSSRDWDLPLEDVATELNRIQRATNYLVSELRFEDVLASNSVTDKGLLAALTGARNYGSSYFPNLWSGEEHRYVDQKKFADSPSKKSYEALRDGCVTWFYYDKDKTAGKVKFFEPYATSMYEDEFGTVLKLSETYPLPDECLD